MRHFHFINFIPTRFHAGLALLTGCLLLSHAAFANDFPTLDRALFIEECMAVKGSRNYETLYGCACSLDKIAAKMNFEEYIEADSYMRMRNARGERAGMFRTKKARGIRKNFEEIKANAEKSCFSQQVKFTNQPSDKKDS